MLNGTVSIVGFQIIGAVFIVQQLHNFVSASWHFIRCYFQNKEDNWKELGSDCRYSRWAVVTGPTRGLGKYFSLALADRGFSLVLVGRDTVSLQKCEMEIKQKFPKCNFLLLEIDLAKNSTNSAALEMLSSIDVAIIINNAGQIIELPQELAANDPVQLERLITVNCFSVAMMLYKVLISRKKDDTKKIWIINLGSIAASYPLPLQGVYAASKQFVRYLTTVAAMEHDKSGEAFALLTPSYILTDMTTYWYNEHSLECPSAEKFVDSAFQALGNIIDKKLISSSVPLVECAGWAPHEIIRKFMTAGGEIGFSIGGLLMHKYRLWCLKL